MIKVKDLWVYPVKSCAGIQLQEMSVNEWGPIFDREWMLVDENGKFLSQREHPKLAQIKTNIDGQDLYLIIEDEEYLIPMHPTEVKEPTKKVSIWNDTVDAYDEGDEIALVLTKFVGIDCRLVRFGEKSERFINPKYGIKTQTRFSDAMPILLVNEASLQELSQKAGVEIPANRFRYNILIEGAEKFAEDHWQKLIIGDVELQTTKKCARCVITTVDQESGKKMGAEPLKTLNKIRREESKVVFGQYFANIKNGTLSVGDEVKIYE